MKNTSLYTLLARKEYVVLPGLLKTAECASILNELTADQFIAAEPIVGKRNVQQCFSKKEIFRNDGGHPSTFSKIGKVQSFLTYALGVELQFNDFCVNWYTPSDVGISPHRDSSRFVRCIAILLLKGRSNFYLYKDETIKGSRLVDAKEGDCILLRAPGIGRSEFGPYHGVANIKEERVSLALRQMKSE